MRQKRTLLITTALLLLMIFITSIFLATPLVAAPQSSDHPASTAEQRHLVIATTDNGPISIDRLLYTAFKNIRYNVDFICPIIRDGYIYANEGVCDGVIAAYPSLDRTYVNLRQVPVPLENINIYVFAPQGSDLQINSWDELSGLHVGILDNRTYILERLLSQSTRITTKDTNRAVLDGIVNGEYDVAVLVERDHETLGEMHSVTRIGKVDRLTEYLYLNAKHEALIPQLSAALVKMFNDGSAGWILNDLPSPDINQKKTIVHIISSNTETMREDQFSEAMKKQFEDDLAIEWKTVILDTKRFNRDKYNIPYIAYLLRTDCVSRNIAAIIVSGDTALEFLADYYYLYFRNIPVLFYGVSEEYGAIIHENKDSFTGILKNIAAYETVEAALELFPNTTNIYVLNDYTAEGLEYRNAIEAELQPFAGRLNIEYSDDISYSSLLRQLRTLPEDSLVLIGSYFTDANYQYYTMGEMKRLMERNCAAPIFSIYSTELSYNALGGKCLDYQKYGDEIASMLQQLLDGVKIADIPIIINSTAYNSWVFDKNQLGKFNIKEAALPAGAVILNRIPSLREANPQLANAITALLIITILLMAGTSIFFITKHRHTKLKDKLQKELAIEKSTLETMFLSAPEIIYVKDLSSRYTRVNKRFEEHFGCLQADIIGKDDFSLDLSAEVIERHFRSDRTAVKENRLVRFEESLPSANGDSHFFEIIKTPLLNNGVIMGTMGIAKDVTRHKIMEEEAKAASQAKSNFLSQMSHEIRTPLNAIIGMIKIGLETIDIDKKNNSLEKADNASKHLLGIINNVLDLSKIEAGEFELSYNKFNLEEMLINVTNVANVRAEEKKQNFVVNINENVPVYIEGDEIRLSQVITNLLTNAIKFTPKYGIVTLDVENIAETGDRAELKIQVTDTGIGIAKEQQEQIFASFKQADASIGKEYGGTGLGLAISKQIVDRMGGEIRIDSVIGQGAKFIFSINVKKFEGKHDITLDNSIKAENIRILAVDDSAEVRDVFMHIMEGLELACDVASSGAEALEMIKTEEEQPYNIFFVDWQMPGMDGIELTKKIKEINGENSVVIMISVTEWSNIKNDAISAGVNHFIPKPLFTSTLINAINMCIGTDLKEAAESRTKRSAKPRHNFSGHTLLLVEDLEINREIVSAIFEGTDAVIENAEDGEAGVTMFKNDPQKYSMILMDINMPGMDGYEATEQIRALDLPKAKEIPIIAMTANVFKEDIDKCLASGMNDHVGKPIDADYLFKLMNKYLTPQTPREDKQNMKNVYILNRGITCEYGEQN